MKCTVSHRYFGMRSLPLYRLIPGSATEDPCRVVDEECALPTHAETHIVLLCENKISTAWLLHGQGFDDIGAFINFVEIEGKLKKIVEIGEIYEF